MQASTSAQMPAGHVVPSGHDASALQVQPGAAPQLAASVCVWQTSDAVYARIAESVDPPPFP